MHTLFDKPVGCFGVQTFNVGFALGRTNLPHEHSMCIVCVCVCVCVCVWHVYMCVHACVSVHKPFLEDIAITFMKTLQRVVLAG